MDSCPDDPVIATNDYATLCKYQAVTSGYYKDEFINRFVSSRAKSTCLKKAPEINRGYYIRSASIAHVVEKFIDSHIGSQIISLGAGFDTLHWRLKRLIDYGSRGVKFVEVDLYSVVMSKISFIRRHKELSSILNNNQFKGDCLHSDDYHLLSIDLRDIERQGLINKLMVDCGLEKDKPTICIAECVLVFMPIEDSGQLIDSLSNNFEYLTFVNYEQVNMEDRFGHMMMSNMTAQNCNLAGVPACSTMQSQSARFQAAGLDQIRHWTMTDIYYNLLLPAERDRIEKIEFLDEKELLSQLLDHYCLIIASKQEIDWVPDDEFWSPKACQAP